MKKVIIGVLGVIMLIMIISLSVFSIGKNEKDFSITKLNEESYILTFVTSETYIWEMKVINNESLLIYKIPNEVFNQRRVNRQRDAIIKAAQMKEVSNKNKLKDKRRR